MPKWHQLNLQLGMSKRRSTWKPPVSVSDHAERVRERDVGVVGAADRGGNRLEEKLVMRQRRMYGSCTDFEKMRSL